MKKHNIIQSLIETAESTVLYSADTKEELLKLYNDDCIKDSGNDFGLPTTYDELVQQFLDINDGSRTHVLTVLTI